MEKGNLRTCETPNKPVAAKSHTSVHYSTTFYDQRGIHIDAPDKEEEHGESALTGLRHMTGLFVMLSLVSEEKIGRSDFNELTNALNEVGDLGARIADSTYSHVAELGESKE
jgi:hypothetical protein